MALRVAEVAVFSARCVWRWATPAEGRRALRWPLTQTSASGHGDLDSEPEGMDRGVPLHRCQGGRERGASCEAANVESRRLQESRCAGRVTMTVRSWRHHPEDCCCHQGIF